MFRFIQANVVEITYLGIGTEMIFIKVILLGAPLLLFMFKNILPLLFKAAYSNITISDKHIGDEFIKLSVDYLFAAISYILPKFVEALCCAINFTQKIEQKNGSPIVNDYTDQLKEQFAIMGKLAGIGVVLMLILPFIVSLNDVAIKYGDSGETRKKGIIIVAVYIVCIGASIYSVSLY